MILLSIALFCFQILNSFQIRVAVDHAKQTALLVALSVVLVAMYAELGRVLSERCDEMASI